MSNKLVVSHIEYVDIPKVSAMNLNEADLKELDILEVESTWALVASCIKSMTRKCYKVVRLDDDKILAVYGVTTDGLIWFLSDVELKDHYREFIKRSRLYYNDLLSDVITCMNKVHSEHDVAIRWLEWLGVNVDKERPIDINGHIFYPIYINNKEVRSYV